MDKIIFELITPPTTWNNDKIAEWILHVTDILGRNNIRYLNLPEVVNENREGDRIVPFLEKMNNIEFMKLIKGRMETIIPIPNKICVRMEKRNTCAGSMKPTP